MSFRTTVVTAVQNPVSSSVAAIAGTRSPPLLTTQALGYQTTPTGGRTGTFGVTTNFAYSILTLPAQSLSCANLGSAATFDFEGVLDLSWGANNSQCVTIWLDTVQYAPAALLADGPPGYAWKVTEWYTTTTTTNRVPIRVASTFPTPVTGNLYLNVWTPTTAAGFTGIGWATLGGGAGTLTSQVKVRGRTLEPIAGGALTADAAAPTAIVEDNQ